MRESIRCTASGVWSCVFAMASNDSPFSYLIRTRAASRGGSACRQPRSAATYASESSRFPPASARNRSARRSRYDARRRSSRLAVRSSFRNRLRATVRIQAPKSVPTRVLIEVEISVHEHLLDEVLGGVAVAQENGGDPPDALLVDTDQPRERLGLPGEHLRDNPVGLHRGRAGCFKFAFHGHSYESRLRPVQTAPPLRLPGMHNNAKSSGAHGMMVAER